MLYRLTAPLEGTVILRPAQPRICALRDGLEFALLADNTGRVTHVSVQMRVPDERLQQFRSSIGPGSGATKATIDIGGDPELFRTLLSELQALESHFAFEVPGAIRRVAWRDCQHEFIAESEEESRSIPVTSLTTKQGYRETPALIAENGFATLVGATADDTALVPCKAFWNEGLNRFHDLQYAQAFHHFYFVIEDLFAQRKSGEKETLKAFHASDELTRILDRALATFTNPQHAHAERLRAALADEGCVLSAAGLAKYVFRVRGRLHHYSSASSRPMIHPHRQEPFETAALVAMFVARSALDQRTKLQPSSRAKLRQT